MSDDLSSHELGIPSDVIGLTIFAQIGAAAFADAIEATMLSDGPFELNFDSQKKDADPTKGYSRYLELLLENGENDPELKALKLRSQQGLVWLQAMKQFDNYLEEALTSSLAGIEIKD